MLGLRVFVFILFMTQAAALIAYLQRAQLATKEDLDILESTIEAKLKKIEALKKEKQYSTPIVSFSVGFRNDPVPIKYRNGQILIFDDVYNNYGKGYSHISGKFRAPVSGLYVFTLNVYPKESLECRIMKEAKSRRWLVANPRQTQSIQDVMHLKKGQEVWVIKTHGGDHFRGGQLTTYSGFLVRADGK